MYAMRKVRVTDHGAIHLNLPEGTELWVKTSEINEFGVALKLYSGGKTLRPENMMATIRQLVDQFDDTPSLEFV